MIFNFLLKHFLVLKHAGNRHFASIKRIENLIDDSGILAAIDLGLTIKLAKIMFFP